MTVIAEKIHAPDIWKSMTSKRKIWMQAPCQFKADSSEAVRREKNRVYVVHMPMSKASMQMYPMIQFRMWVPMAQEDHFWEGGSEEDRERAAK